MNVSTGASSDKPYEVAETIEMDDEDFVIAQRWEHSQYWDYDIMHKATGQRSSLRIAKVNGSQLKYPGAKRKVNGLIPPDSDANTDVPRTAPIPPSNSSKLYALFEQAYNRGHEHGQGFKQQGLISDFLYAKAMEAESLLQSERQKWASELVEKLPKHRDHTLSGSRGNAAYKMAQNEVIDQVLTIIKETTGILHTPGTPTAPSSEAGNLSEEAR